MSAKSSNITVGMIAGIGFALGLAGGMAIKNSRRSKLKTLGKKTVKTLDAVGSMLQSVANLTN